MTDDWIAIKKGRQWRVNAITNTKQPFYISISNRYSTLPQFATDLPPSSPTQQQPRPSLTPIPSNLKHKAQCKALECLACCHQLLHKDTLINQHITWAKDERTSLAKADTTSIHKLAIDSAHKIIMTTAPTPILQKGRNTTYALSTTICQALQIFSADHHVHFNSPSQVRYYDPTTDVPMIMFDSGADGHYLSEDDCINAGLPIVRPSNK